jgi:hypothetical protein
VTPRNPRLIEGIWLSNQCCRSAHAYLPDATPIAQATAADYERTGWQIEMEDDSFRTVYECLTIPPAGQVVVRDGRCGEGGGGQAAA